LNAPWPAEEVWDHLPASLQQTLIAKQAKVYTINATQVARAAGMGGRINTIMQTCFFAVSGVLPREEAIAAIKDSIRKAYSKKGEEIVQMNLRAVDNTVANMFEVKMESSRHLAGWRCVRRCPPARPTSCGTCWARSLPVEATACR
jgi:pyruvate-ferredoxin/flavodoxin oxidoreductase